MSQDGRSRPNRAYLVIGLAMLAAGIFITVRGIEHVISGLPVPGNRYSPTSSGWDNVLAGIFIVAMGGAFTRRWLKGRK